MKVLARKGFYATADEAIEERRELEKKIKIVNEEIEQIHQGLNSINVSTQIKTHENLIKRIDKLETLPMEQQNILVKTIFNKVVYKRIIKEGRNPKVSFIFND